MLCQRFLLASFLSARFTHAQKVCDYNCCCCATPTHTQRRCQARDRESDTASLLCCVLFFLLFVWLHFCIFGQVPLFRLAIWSFLLHCLPLANFYVIQVHNNGTGNSWEFTLHTHTHSCDFSHSLAQPLASLAGTGIYILISPVLFCGRQRLSSGFCGNSYV